MKRLSLVLIFTHLFLLNSCYFYQATTVVYSEQDSWEAVFEKNRLGPKPLIKFIEANNYYHLDDYTVEGDLLSGNLVEGVYFPIPDRETFSRSSIPRNRRSELRRSLHIVVPFPLEDGEFAIRTGNAVSMARYPPNVEAGVAGTIGLSLLGAGAVIGISAAIINAICSCPRVYTTDANGNKVFHGSLFTGAISKSFERTDLLPLEDIVPINNEVVLNIVNELPEEEYINELKLLKAKHTPGYNIGKEIDGNLFEYQHIITPDEAVSIHGTSILKRISKQDDFVFDFSDEANSEELNSAIFTFDKSQLRTTANPKLIVFGRQTEWMEQTVEVLFSLYGTDFQKLNNKMDKFPRKLYDQYCAKRGISMNAYIMTDNGWKSLETFHHAGAVKQKLMGMNLDLSEISGNEVQIKLEAAFKFWELDQVVISDDWQPLSNLEEVPMKWAVNESGEEVSQLIQNIDKDYAIQPAENSYIQVSFEHTAYDNGLYILQGTGYYHHVRDYTHEPNMALVKQIKKLGKMGAQTFSHQLYLYNETLNAVND